jgi:hypothetical protein
MNDPATVAALHVGAKKGAWAECGGINYNRDVEDERVKIYPALLAAKLHIVIYNGGAFPGAPRQKNIKRAPGTEPPPPTRTTPNPPTPTQRRTLVSPSPITSGGPTRSACPPSRPGPRGRRPTAPRGGTSPRIRRPGALPSSLSAARGTWCPRCSPCTRWTLQRRPFWARASLPSRGASCEKEARAKPRRGCTGNPRGKKGWRGLQK